MSSNDFKVRRRWPSEIADLAARWRQAGSDGHSANWFDVVNFLNDIVVPGLASKDRRVEIELVDDEEPEQAWVDIAKGKLFVRGAVWQKAKQHDPRARLIIAHEIGHLILHTDQVYSFTKPYEYGLRSIEDNESAEHQANWFAWSLLLPDSVLLRLRKTLTTSSIATLTLVEDKVVELRLNQLALDKRYRGSFTGDECPECGSLDVARNGITSVCDQCGLQIESS
ncbi:MAG: ImmA/IrrE family metallo-endopeptidase [Devosia sp.]|nr:ImmA/IrrE family metallo-endopeptidase [Devosia sp.]